jgi:hypothetical protein
MFDSTNLPPELLPVVVAAIIQFLKAIPPIGKFIAGKEKDLLPMAVAVGLAYATALPNPIVMGIMLGLSACGGYDLLKGKNSSEKSEKSP